MFVIYSLGLNTRNSRNTIQCYRSSKRSMQEKYYYHNNKLMLHFDLSIGC